MNEQINQRYGKVEQVALYTPDIKKAITLHKAVLGLNQWTNDVVTAQGTCFGKAIDGGSVGNLAFNYDLGIEFELLNYVKGINWHSERGRNLDETFLSHMGWHVDDIESEKKYLYDNFGIEVAQELFTQNHTNEFLKENKRTYHYCVFDTLEALGWDLKLIKRIDHA